MDILSLVPQAQTLQLISCHLTAQSLNIGLRSNLPATSCPYCGQLARRQHSHYTRIIRDLPWAGIPVIFTLEVRRFFCDDPGCPHVTFAERFPKLVSPYARQTLRLATLFQQIGLDLGGEAGARLVQQLHLSISPDTLLRRVTLAPEPALETPRVLGIDDWAMKRGHSYGTILIDLEHHQVIDLLPDRKAEIVAAWLRQHPGIEVISRDRGQEYIDAIRSGAPQTIQVADRFHLLQNLFEALQRLFQRSPQEIQRAIDQMRLADPAVNPIPLSKTLQPTSQAPSLKTHRQAKFDAVKTLQAKGLTYRAISRQVGLDRRTVRKYFYLDAPPQKGTGSVRNSKAGPYLSYLRHRWQEGCHCLMDLFAEVRQQGFSGSYGSLRRAVHHQLGVGSLYHNLSIPTRRVNLSPKQAAWAVFSEEEDLWEPVKTLRSALLLSSHLAQQVDPLVREFRMMVQERQADRLDNWLEQAENSQISELKRFAISLRGDYAAVRAALTQPWSNGQTEGQVTRLKMIKRQMYGRAGFPLLRKRVLLAS